MEHYALYHSDVPDVIRNCAATPCMQRLKAVGMNCGCEYTSFPRFANLQPYSRFDHSLGVALIVWHFTKDKAQTVAGLLHDVASPVFAHVVDFLHGDYLKQESTEDGTEAIIAEDVKLQRMLHAHGLVTRDVCDYHRYPVADNDSPRLSADRLEYTLGNLINYRIRTFSQVKTIYADLTVATAADGQDELAFRSPQIAADFTAAALVCSKIYVSDEDRYAMQMLAELLRLALARGVLRESDLTGTEPQVVEKLLRDETTAAEWNTFRSFSTMLCSDAPQSAGAWRQIAAKKRCIDPLIAGVGRVSEQFPALADGIQAFKDTPQTAWIAAAETR